MAMPEPATRARKAGRAQTNAVSGWWKFAEQMPPSSVGTMNTTSHDVTLRVTLVPSWSSTDFRWRRTNSFRYRRTPRRKLSSSCVEGFRP
ncbi:hypothetical protein ACIBEA_35940 [Streptomyces sp. NPDC051555]|uniref:hypothetical protein n=1 Tax=Streptomyces sp. NPDC051555 TaxID=3365657 RepID=UPI0037BD024A